MKNNYFIHKYQCSSKFKLKTLIKIFMFIGQFFFVTNNKKFSGNLHYTLKP